MQLNFLTSVPMNLDTYLKEEVLLPEGIQQFHKTIYDYYALNGRTFAWRFVNNPYFVVVSEIMLQQTQTERVKSKYEQFITAFPSIEALAQASTAEVITVWQGLGYNRRALALHTFAQRIVKEYQGIIPQDPEVLQTFKGIGTATAASICTFAFNSPTIFIETNIRTVFIHLFFPHKTHVKDSNIVPLIQQTLDERQPRIWYYALMDYGVMLKKQHKNPSRKSAHYTVQSKFEGSNRQIRGKIIEELTLYSVLTIKQLQAKIQRDPQKIVSLLKNLEKEGFIKKIKRGYSLA